MTFCLLTIETNYTVIEISIIVIPPTPPAASITAFFITEARWYLNVPHAFCFTTLRRLWRRHLATKKTQKKHLDASFRSIIT